MDGLTQQDSPLSVTANVAGILTFVVAIAAAIYVRVSYLRNSDDEYFRVKASLSWYKTESAWLAELVRAVSADPRQPEYQMYAFVMDDLHKLEQRLLELVAETEQRAANSDDSEGWTVVPRSWSFTTNVAVAWLPVRTKALELVRQRDALTARVQFTQMSMISSRIRDLESRTKWQENRTEESLTRMEGLLSEQRSEMHRLEDMVHRVMHRNRVSQKEKDLDPSDTKSRRVSITQRSPSQQSPTGRAPCHDRKVSNGGSKRRSRSK